MKKLISLIACIAIAASMSACGKKTETPADNNTVATEQNTDGKKISQVGETVIRDSDYNFFFNQYLEQIGDEKKAIEITNEQVRMIYSSIDIGKSLKLDASMKDELINQIKTSYGSDEEYNKFLKEMGIDEEFISKFAEATAYSQAINKYVSENVKSDEDPEKYFKDNYLRAKHVLIMTEGVEEDKKPEKKKLAEDILARAKGGEDFDKLVEEYSEDPGSKSQPDGYVFPEGQMVDEFYQGTKNIGIGEYNLVESSYGYHIIKRLALDETKELYDKFYAESGVKEQIESAKTEKFIEDKIKELDIKISYQL